VRGTPAVMRLLGTEVAAHPSGEESAKQRRDRNFNELLQELRVAQTGVQILLGFVLAMAFSSRFDALGNDERVLYGASVVLATLAMGLLVGPVALHRYLFRHQMKDAIVRLTHLCLAAGLFVLYLAVNAAVLLALWVSVGFVAAALLTTGAALLVGVLWFITPLMLRSRRPAGLAADRAGRSWGAGR
jgi:hypothetical protein